MTRDDPVIDPVILAGSGQGDDEGFALNRAVVRVRIDTVRKRIDLEQGDFGRVDTRPSHNVAVAVTGSLDYSGAEPHLAFGVACTRMPMSVMKRIWPIFVAIDVRKWVEEHVSSGVVERVVSPAMRRWPTSVPTDRRPRRTACRSKWRPAARRCGRSRRCRRSATPTSPCMSPAPPPMSVSAAARWRFAPGASSASPAACSRFPIRIPSRRRRTTTFRIDGTVPAAAELLASDALRDNAGLALDPATSRGTVSAQVAISMLGAARRRRRNAATYTIAADLTNFAADKMLIGQKVEASLLQLTASRAGYQVKGDVKINGTAANLDFRKMTGEPDGELRLQATSTRPRAAGSASISAAPSPARSR